jgi:MFS family permease
MGVFLATIDGSIVNIGLNTLVNDLQQPLLLVEWVVLAYMLTISTLLLSVGRLSDMVGRKKLYLAGIFLFKLGSGLCGLTSPWENGVAFYKGGFLEFGATLAPIKALVAGLQDTVHLSIVLLILALLISI